MTDVYIDIETRAAPELQPWAQEEPPLSWEYWLEAMEAQAPTVRERGAVKAGNRKGETRERYIAEQIAADEQRLREWRRGLRAQYEAELEERARRLEEQRANTALDAFAGGQIGMIGVAVGERPVQVIRSGNDPARTEDASTRQIAWLRQHREYRLIKRLSLGLQTVRERGPMRLVAWNGYHFDFGFLARRAAHLARPDQGREALTGELVDGLDRDLIWLVGLCWHDVPWRAESQRQLHDPREVWALGQPSRFARGRLPAVARYLGWRPDERAAELLQISHEQIPSLLESGTEEDEALVAELCTLDVCMLRYVHETMLLLGIGR